MILCGPENDPVIDSALSREQALDGLPAACPAQIRDRQELVELTYISFDGLWHRGQLVIDHDLVADIRRVFELAAELRFPIGSVIPCADRRFRNGLLWDDNLSMAANNTSAFNFRPIEGSTSLSNHAFGRAIDINPLQNPYIRGETVAPPGAVYDPADPGTLTADHPIVRLFLELGWNWGGNWGTLKDYQHFERPTP
jgi:peptidoglycan L-alanyl-D-glutamate endopeptidase CwlK